MQLFVWYYYYIGISCLFTHDWYVQWIMKRQMIMTYVQQFAWWMNGCFVIIKTTGFSTIGCNKNQLITIIISICFFIYCSASIVCIFIIFYTIIRVQTFRSKIRRGKSPFLNLNWMQISTRNFNSNETAYTYLNFYFSSSWIYLYWNRCIVYF